MTTTKFLTIIFSLTILLSGCGSSNGGSSSGSPTATLSADPATLATGSAQFITLNYGSTNATGGSINQGVGPVGASGSVKVTAPKATTIYVFTATGPNGSATAQATVTVSPAPAVTMTASANPVSHGGSTTLTVAATNATQVVITDNADSNTYSLPGTGGKQVVSPTIATTYLATATGADGSSATATVTVTIVPTATLTANVTSTWPNQPVLLSFSSTNATDGSLNGVDVGTGDTDNSIAEYPTQTTTYTYTVTGPGGTATASATVTVLVSSFNGLTADPANLGLQAQDVDPNGSVGTKQFVEYVNLQYQAYDKTTFAPVWSSPQIIGTPWLNTLNQGDDPNCDSHAGSDGSVTGIHLDAVIDFDRLAQRWVVMGKADFSGPAYYLCLAVSNTDDLSSLTLGWYGYDIPLTSNILGTTLEDENGQSTYVLNFPDWPKLGTWTDAYYIALDVEEPPAPVGNGDEIGAAVCVFDRNDIIAQTTASPPSVQPPGCVLPVPLDTSGTYLGHSLIPADIDGTTAPPSGRPEYMVSIENPSIAENQTTSTSLNLWEAQANWGATPPVNVTPTTLTVAPYTPGCYLYDAGFPAVTNCVEEPQNAGPEIIDSVGDRLMPRFPYRNFGSYESYLVSHTIQTGPGASGTGPNLYQTGIRWYELRINGSAAPYLYQSNTINPDTILFRFLPSIAQDQKGNAAVGYSVSNQQTNPGVDFSYWSLGTLSAPTTEVTILNGPGEELTDTSSGTPGEWGTYSGMTVDPVDGCTFWYVNEFYPSPDSYNNWATLISNFQIPGCQ